MNNLPALVTLVGYALGLVAISVWATRKAKTEESFFLGERNLGPWVAGLAYAASSSSAWPLPSEAFTFAVTTSEQPAVKR